MDQLIILSIGWAAFFHPLLYHSQPFSRLTCLTFGYIFSFIFAIFAIFPLTLTSVLLSHLATLLTYILALRTN
jgi:hypothetical protein